MSGLRYRTTWAKRLLAIAALLPAAGAICGSARADLTIATQISVTGLTADANGNVPPPAFPLTVTTYFQGSKSRSEFSDGTVFLFDSQAGTAYQLDPKANTYRSTSIKTLEDFSTAFPPRVGKHLSIAEDLNFFSSPETATYLNTQTSKCSVMGAAHLLIVKPIDDGGPPDGGNHHQHGDSGGFPGTGGGGYPDGGRGGGVHPGEPTNGGDEGGIPAGSLQANDMRDGNDTVNGGTDGDTSTAGDNGPDAPSPTGDTVPGSDSGPDGDGGPRGGSSSAGDDKGGPAYLFKKANLPDYYISGAVWESPAVKLPKDKHFAIFPLALQVFWSGGPFVSDLLKQLNQDRELPLHAEFSIKEIYPSTGDGSNYLLDRTIRTKFDVTSISTAPIDPSLFDVPQSYKKDNSAVLIPQLAAPIYRNEDPSLQASN